jgi:hypothetical protein
MTGLCRAVAGTSLGLFFGSVAFTTLLVPPLIVSCKSTRARLTTPLAASLGAMLVWLTSLGSEFTFAQWTSCSLVLLGYSIALGGVCSVVLALRVTLFLASGAVTIIGLLWLTWPVWLSRALLAPSGDTLASWLIPAHPLFAINRVLSHFDTWDRYPLAYGQLTVLNQDVFYAMPTTIAWTFLVHGAIGVFSFVVGWRVESRRAFAGAAVSPAVPDPAESAK